MEWVKAARAAAKKGVKSPSGRDYEIRKVTSSELIEASVDPIISQAKPETEKTEIAALIWFASNADKAIVARIRAVVSKGVVLPQVVYDDAEDTVPEGAVHARWIAEDEDFLYLSILEFSGISSKEERERLEKLLKKRAVVRILDRIAKRYGRLPSELIQCDAFDLSFNYHVFRIAQEDEAKYQDKLIRELKRLSQKGADPSAMLLFEILRNLQ